jgi:hypothetical protein
MKTEFIPRRGMRFRTDEEAKWFFRWYAEQAGFGFNMGTRNCTLRLLDAVVRAIGNSIRRIQVFLG